MGRRKGIVKWILYAGLMLLTFLLQTTALADVRFMGCHANLMPVVVAVVAMFEGGAGGGGIGFAAGLICDALIPPAEAFFTLYLLFAGLMIGRACDVFFKKRLFTAVIWSLAALIVQEFLYFSIFYLIAGRADAQVFYTVALPEAAISLPFVPVIYLPARQIYRRYGENNQ